MLHLMFSTQYLTGYSALLSVAACAGCFGWVAPIMNYLLDPSSDMYMTSAEAGFMLAVIEFGELFMSLPAGLLADKYGRKICILITGPMYALSWIVILLWKSYIVLCAMRIVQGVAMAFTFGVVPLYLGEISSPSQRGSVTGLFSFAWYFGYLLQYCVGPSVSYVAFTVFTACIPVLFTATFLFQPESPYFLLMKDKVPEAKAALQWLRKGSDESSVLNELEEMKETIRTELASKSSWKDLVDTPEDKRALLIILVIGCTRILSGANALQSYSTKLFSESGSVFLSPDTLTILMGLVLVVGSIVNTFIVDSLGRRPLLLISCIGSLVSLVVVALYFSIMDNSIADISSFCWLVPLGVLSYSLFSVVGLHPISMTYTSELFTTKTRGKAASVSNINLTVCVFVCIEVYQLVGDNLGTYVVFWFFSAVDLIGTVVLYCLAPETKSKTFSQIRKDLLKKNYLTSD